MKTKNFTRRSFLQHGLTLTAGAPLALSLTQRGLFGREATTAPDKPSPVSRPAAEKVAIVSCRSYGPEVRAALEKSFDLLGGIGSLVKNKTVTVKLNLTGTNFAPFLDRPVGETYMTHYATALALGSLLFAAGARRLRFVESTQSKSELGSSLSLADWDVKALEALGKVEFENTRNLGQGKSYAHVRVPTGGYMFSGFDFNHAYEETDVMVSLAKLKNHITAGVTLSMKNLFGITPNSLYGDQAGSEEATDGRGPLHNPKGFDRIRLPGLKEGITSMSGGEGPWCGGAAKLKFTAPGVLIVGLNPVSTDAVGTAVMGYENPRATRATRPFDFCDNHLLLAEQAGLGTADLAKIEVRGLAID